jgi:hypothetical protein
MPLPPRSWKLNAGYLQGASKEQLVNLGKMTSLEHRRHVVDPTLLGLHEARAGRGVLGVLVRRSGAHPGASAAPGLHDVL